VSERLVVAAIMLGTLAVFGLGFTEPRSSSHALWMGLDVTVVLYYVVEQILKLRLDGWNAYWSVRWNRFDLVVVVLSLPLLAAPIADTSLFIGVPVLRVIRLFRLFRLLRFIPDHAHLGAGIRRAMKASVGVFLGIAIVNFIFAMGAEVLFGNDAPALFGNPARACYSMFRIFTIEGWHEIPDAVALHASDGWAVFARIYFGVAVLIGGILGLALGNAVFVDQMMADNNDEVERDVDKMTAELRMLRRELGELRALLAAKQTLRPRAPSYRRREPTSIARTSSSSPASRRSASSPSRARLRRAP